MKSMVIYVLWDEDNGYYADRFYLDEKSANVALQERYTEYWIKTKKAMVYEKVAVSYFTE